MKYLKVYFIIIFYLIMASNVIAGELHLALADSVCSVMKRAGAAFSAESSVSVQFTCKSSGLLAQGIRAGIIKADFFLSANKKWMDKMVTDGLVEQTQVESLWANELIVVGPSGINKNYLKSVNDLKDKDIKTIYIGEPSRAPFGRYAKNALKKAGLWQGLRDKIATRKNISLAIQSVAKGSGSTVGIIYHSGLDSSLEMLFTISQDLSGEILYYFAPLKASKDNADLKKFIKFIQGEKTARLFQKAGFIVVNGAGI